MRLAFGMKAHSGSAALVVLGERDGDLVRAVPTEKPVSLSFQSLTNIQS